MYKALYRRYRPKNFNEILGQDHITTTLKNQIKNDNIGHAYLFSGTHGTGKTSAAKILARAVNCLDNKGGEPCNECRNCLEILAESTVDVIEMDAASNNSVNDIRELREKVIYPPTNIKKKVYIIDEVHMLSTSAFNALLKTLEEPPRHLIFILATTEPEKLPQTILSRCQRFDFNRIPTKDIIGNMEKIVGDLEMQIDEDALNLIARNADGAMRDALSLLDQCVSFSDKNITYETALDLLGITNRAIIFELVDHIIEERLEEALNSLDEINSSGKNISTLVNDLISHFRNLMIVKSSKEPENILEIDNISEFKAQSEKVNIEFILKAINILIDAENKGRWSGEIRLILEMAIINMVDIEEELSLMDRVKRLEEGFVPKTKAKEVEQPKAQANTIRETPTEKAKTISSKQNIKDEKPSEKTAVNTNEGTKSFENLDLQTISQHWDTILKEIKSEKISLYALIMEGSLYEFQNSQIEINFDEKFGFHHSAVNKEDNKELVEAIVSKYFGQELVVSFSLGKLNIKTEAKEDTSSEDGIKKAKEVFGEDILEIN